MNSGKIEEIKKELMHYLKDFSRNKTAYDKQTLQEIDATTQEHLQEAYEGLEAGFVDIILEIHTLREQITETKEEIISDGLISSYKHRFGQIDLL